MNISLVNTLAQIILSLPQEEQRLLQQQLAGQSRKSRIRRRVPFGETGDSFDYCVADITTSKPKELDLDNSFTEPDRPPQMQSEHQSASFKVHGVEARSQKSLSMFRECLPL
jgi:hypothetical protein